MDGVVEPIKIANRLVGPGHPCFIIAEAGVNHDGDIDTALKLVDTAADAGADAVKFQTFSAERLASATAPKADYQLQNSATTESQLEMLQRLELSAADHHALLERCRQRNIMFMSTPFDEASADFLMTLGISVLKIPSGELTNLPLLAHVARTRLPLIVSTGMSTLDEVSEAVATIRESGCENFVLLHCVSNYPAAPADVNLRAMDTMRNTFDIPVGYSDHTLGIEVALAAAARDACVIEKHFTLDRSRSGPDHAASLVPDELRLLVQGVRTVESAIGDGLKKPARSEAPIAAVARKSLAAACDIPAGTVISEGMITSKRPGTGLPHKMRTLLIGRTTRESIRAGEFFKEDSVT